MNFTMWELTAKNLDIKLRAAEARIAELEEALRLRCVILMAEERRTAELEKGLLPLAVKAYWNITDEDRRRARELLPDWDSRCE